MKNKKDETGALEFLEAPELTHHSNIPWYRSEQLQPLIQPKGYKKF